MEGNFKVLFQDKIQDPYFNLAMEEYFLQKMTEEKPDYNLFLLYSNEKSIVCGKNQSIWKEANLRYCRENDIKIAKRLSGGGTVYHDPGNLNFCYITNRKKEWVSNFSVFNQPVISFLHELGVNARENERHDILIDGKKISGNAQHLSKNLLVSHATLLFDADLNKVSSALRHPYISVESRGIDSKRVPVTNISKYLDQAPDVIDFSSRLFSYISKSFESHEVITLSQKEIAEIQFLADQKFHQDEWVYGQSPDTKIEISLKGENIEILLKKGICEEVTINNKDLKEFLEGQIFNYSALKNRISSFESSRQKQLFINFLENSGL